MTQLDSLEGEGQHLPWNCGLIVVGSRAVAAAVMVLDLAGPPAPPPLVAALQHPLPDYLDFG